MNNKQFQDDVNGNHIDSWLSCGPLDDKVYLDAVTLAARTSGERRAGFVAAVLAVVMECKVPHSLTPLAIKVVAEALQDPDLDGQEQDMLALLNALMVKGGGRVKVNDRKFAKIGRKIGRRVADVMLQVSPAQGSA